MSWILVIFVHAGMLSDSDSMSITNVPGFTSQAECEAAGKAASRLTQGTKKDTQFVCLVQKK